jgi:hypothetical protein
MLESLVIVISPVERKDWVVQDTWTFEPKNRILTEFIA